MKTITAALAVALLVACCIQLNPADAVRTECQTCGDSSPDDKVCKAGLKCSRLKNSRMKQSLTHGSCKCIKNDASVGAEVTFTERELALQQECEKGLDIDFIYRRDKLWNVGYDRDHCV